MEKTARLEAHKRQMLGTRRARRLRRAGLVPGIVYGHEAEPVPVTVSGYDLAVLIQHGHRLLHLQLDGEEQQVLIKDLQYDHLARSIIHVDMVRVALSDVVSVEVPIIIKGVAKGTHEGGILEVHADKIEIECPVTAIPEAIEVWVDGLGVGDAIHAGKVQLPAGAKLVSSPELLIVTCRMVAEAKTTEQVQMETPAAPEVIREAKKAESDQQKEQD
ncbi:MAG: 50S ribosomal protein L25 [Sedimentisphaerales bacterium]|jgi:large subunit ribosomal protein L25|nr:50S ribosomal protein L25 [Sedimentisphaerales bacterium]